MNARKYDQYVLQTLRSGSLTRAASALGISQPALSSGLSGLESELGFRVFDRRTTPVTLTAEGRLYVDYISRLGTLTEDFTRRLADLRDRRASSVIVGGPAAYARSLVADAVIRLLERRPDYRVEVKTASVEELVDMAGRGEVNCFIATTDRLPEAFECRFVKRERLCLCVPKSDPANERLAADLAAGSLDYSVLDGSRFICLSEGQPLQTCLERFAAEYGLSLSGRIVVRQAAVAVSFAARGAGMCFASEDLLSGIDLGRLCVYDLPDSISDRSIYVAYDRELYRSEACQALIDALVNADQK